MTGLRAERRVAASSLCWVAGRVRCEALKGTKGRSLSGGKQRGSKFWTEDESVKTVERREEGEGAVETGNCLAGRGDVCVRCE